MHTDTWVFQSAPPPPPPPSISLVVSASGFDGFSAVAPDTLVEIYGNNFAPDTRQWAGSDFTGNNAPTSLDGVQVTIGGQNAFITTFRPAPDRSMPSFRPISRRAVSERPVLMFWRIYRSSPQKRSYQN